MLWSQQFSYFDVDKWLKEHCEDPMKRGGRSMRNSEWMHMANQHVISMPDPYVVNVNGQEFRVNYLPAESDTGMFGGNSNWRGPIWMPVNAILIRALLSFYLYYGDNFKIECPTGSGKLMNLFEVPRNIADRLTGIFLRDESECRPAYGGTEKF